ncbi:MAG: tetratricopeptide repeat protein [Salinivirgaceae bacterium]|nr:tetratricopeptide repeat protein [Salinivirgaceae bacterium]
MRTYKNIDWRLFTLLLVVFALYVNTLKNQYALDDAIVITENQHVKKGFRGIGDILSNETFQGFFGQQKELVAGGRYRPLTLVMFAIEYQFFGQNPFIGHLINILLYALTVLILWQVLSMLIQNPDSNWLTIAWITALLFAIHPIHTEAVANIKGRDEILTFLLALLAWQKTIQWTKDHNVKHLIWATILLFLGMLSKEHAVAFVFIIPFSIWFFKLDTAKKSIIAFVPLLIAALAFVILRHNVLGGTRLVEGIELMNNPFVDATMGQRYATILFTFLWYLKLLVWPHPLTYDYYPYHVSLIDPNSIITFVGIIILATLTIIAIIGLRKRNLASFWIIFFGASFILMSNLFFTVGTFMNERFMFIPSVSICFAIAFIIVKLHQTKFKKQINILVAAIIILGAIKTIDRNGDWYNDEVLFMTDIQVSSNSAKSNVVVGGKLSEQAQKTTDSIQQRKLLIEANNYLDKALEIHPSYNDAKLLKGNVVFQLQSAYAAMSWYLSILERAKQHTNAWKNSLIAASAINDTDQRIEIYSKLHNIDSNRFEPIHNLGLLYSRNKLDYQRGIPLLEKAVRINPSSKEAIKDLGIAYGMTGNYLKSEVLLTKATQQFPNDGQLQYNLAITLYNLKKFDEAQQAFDKAAKLDKTIKPVKINQK